MKLDAMKRQGKRSDLTSAQLTQKLTRKISRQFFAEQEGQSQDQIRRYIRLKNLMPELLEFIDLEKIKLCPAVELSYLDEEAQREETVRVVETLLILTAATFHFAVAARRIKICLWGRFRPGLWEHPQLTHYPKQALRAAGATPLAQPVPQFHHTQRRIPVAHIPDQFEFRFCVLVGVAVGPPGLAGQGLRRPAPAGLPEVDVGPAFVVFSAGTADAIFLRIFYQGLPIRHALCYTLAHEGYGFLSLSCCLQLQL